MTKIQKTSVLLIIFPFAIMQRVGHIEHWASNIFEVTTTYSKNIPDKTVPLFYRFISPSSPEQKICLDQAEIFRKRSDTGQFFFRILRIFIFSTHCQVFADYTIIFSKNYNWGMLKRKFLLQLFSDLVIILGTFWPFLVLLLSWHFFGRILRGM